MLSDLQNAEIKNPKGMPTKLKQLGDVEVEFASPKEKETANSFPMNIKITFFVDRKKAAEAGMTVADVSEAISKTMAGMGKREMYKLSDSQNTEIKTPNGTTMKKKELGDDEIEFANPQKATHPKKSRAKKWTAC